MTVSQVKNALSGIISELSKTPWIFLRNPTKDFTRKRKLQFQDVVSLLLSMEAKSSNKRIAGLFQMRCQYAYAVCPETATRQNFAGGV